MVPPYLYAHILPLLSPNVYYFFFFHFVFVDLMHIVIGIQHQKKLVEVVLLEELPFAYA